MTTIHEIAVLLLALIAGLLIAYPFGHYAGFHKGRAQGWQEGYFRKIDDDKAKRGPDGRFTKK